MIEGESHSTSHKSSQPHLMKDTAWLNCEWSATQQEWGKPTDWNQSQNIKTTATKRVTTRCQTAKTDIHKFSCSAVYCSLNIRTI